MNAAPNPIPIQPVDFRAPKSGRRGGGRGLWKALLGFLGLLLIVALAGAAWFVFTSQSVEIVVEPTPDTLRISGPPLRLRMGEGWLLRRGDYEVFATLEGYEELHAEARVERDVTTLAFEMEPKPGLLSVQVVSVNEPQAPVAEARVRVAGQEPIGAPVTDLPLPMGSYAVEAEAPRFRAAQTNVTIEGLGQQQALRLVLTPSWSPVRLDGGPGAARVRIDGEARGAFPVEVELEAGRYALEIAAEGHKTLTTQLVVRANTPLRLDGLVLAPADARLRIESSPPDALVTIDDVFAGKTPFVAELAPDRPHRIEFSKSGFREAVREVTLGPDEEDAISVELDPILATVRFSVEPDGTELVVNGESLGPTPEKIELPSSPHAIEIRKSGYEPFRVNVTPRVDFPQDLAVRLEAIPAAPPVPRGLPETIRASNDYELRLLPARQFMMGSSRREQGRRSNETLREVRLTRPFYMGTKEVTNAEFRAFRPGHDSGSVRQRTLNRDTQPVVNVSWEDAAQFCNWLSEQEGLPPVYEQSDNRWVARSPLPDGYRLPTEAEWVLAARFAGTTNALRFAWGDGYPPRERIENYADISARGILAHYLTTYNDGFEVTAPVGSFPPNAWGLYDISGNVAEWCHDFYTIYPFEPGRVFEDPLGPDRGEFRVIRGASWRKSSMTALRLSFCDYGREGRNDVGFRVVRPATEEMKE